MPDTERVTARCVRCGAPGLDPQVVYGQTTHRYEHLPYCPVGRVLRWAGIARPEGWEPQRTDDRDELRRAIR